MKANQAGMTLLEVMIAIAIVATGFLGVIQLQAVSLKANGQTRHKGLANRILSSSIERVALTPHSILNQNAVENLSPDVLAAWREHPYITTGEVPSVDTKNGVYTYSRVVEKLSNGVLAIHCCVYWGAAGNQKTIFGEAVKPPDMEE